MMTSYLYHLLLFYVFHPLLLQALEPRDLVFTHMNLLQDLKSIATHRTSNQRGKNSTSLNPHHVFSRRQEECPPSYPYLCADGLCCPTGYPTCCYDSATCCPSGNFCCGDGENCCKQGSNCVSLGGTHICCPTGSNTCGGTQCCVPGDVCNPNVPPGAGCCAAGSSVCGSACCANGKKCCGDGCCDDDTICCGEYCCASPASCARDTDSQTLMCKTPSVNKPVEVDANETPDLAKNICASMRARGIEGNEEVLTRRPYNSDSERRQIRRKAKCNGRRCVKGSGLSCDEYPPASTQEGYDGLYGIDVFSACIDEGENSLGGTFLSQLYGQGPNSLPAGETFTLRVTNIDCRTVAPATANAKRSIVDALAHEMKLKNKRASNQTSGTVTSLYPATNINGYTQKFVIIPFGDFLVGNYTLTITSNQILTSWATLDSAALYMSSGGPSVPNVAFTTSFSLPDDDFGDTFVGYTDASSINLQWKLTAVTA